MDEFLRELIDSLHPVLLQIDHLLFFFQLPGNSDGYKVYTDRHKQGKDQQGKENRIFEEKHKNAGNGIAGLFTDGKSDNDTGQQKKC